jgi:deazaflavin-dependent oxidoreductase (nitroreductase family)
MALRLKHVDPAERPGLFVRAYAAFSATRLGRFMSRHIGWKVDPFLLRITGGRFASTLVFPTAVLETTGAKSGLIRRNAVIYFNDGDLFTIVASLAGAPRDPGWYFNLKANPDVVFNGRPMRASVVEDEADRERLWGLADRVFPAYARYRRDAARANRHIPIVQLTPTA